MNKKECASAHSRAERGRLRHSSSSCECASPARSAFYFIGSSFGISYEIKKMTFHPLICEKSSFLFLTSLVQSIFMAENLIPVLSYYTLYFTTGKRFRIAQFSFGILLHSIARNSEVASRSPTRADTTLYIIRIHADQFV